MMQSASWFFLTGFSTISIAKSKDSCMLFFVIVGIRYSNTP